MSRPSLARGVLVLYGAEVFAKALGFLVFAYLGRRLGTTAYGDLEFALGVTFVLSLLLESGLGPYAARRAALEPVAVPSLVAGVAALRVLLLAAALPAVAVVAALVARPEQRTLAVLSAAALLPAPFLFPWLFQARHEMGVVAGSSLLRQGVQAALVFLFVTGPTDAVVAIGGDALGLLVVAVLQMGFVRKRIGAVPWRAGFGHALRILRESLPFAASTIAWALRWFAPLLALGFVDAQPATAHFAAGHRLTVAAHSFVWLWFFNLLPSLSRSAATASGEHLRLQRNSLRIVGWLALTGFALGALVADPLLPALFGRDFVGAVPAFRGLVATLGIAFVSGHWRFGLLAFGRPRGDLAANAAGAVVSVVASILVAGSAPGALAAALVLAGAELVTAGVAFGLFRRVCPGIALSTLVRPIGAVLTAGGLALAVFPRAGGLVAGLLFLALVVPLAFALESSLRGRVFGRAGGGAAPRSFGAGEEVECGQGDGGARSI